MGKKPFDLLVVGEINPDLILSGDVTPIFGQVEKLVEDVTLTMGSSAVIFACGATRLGLKTTFIGKVGQDEFGRFMLDSMRARGIHTAGVVIDPTLPTGLSVILNRRGDRAILTSPGTIPALRLADISLEILSQARHLHLTSYFLQTTLKPDVPVLFDLAHHQGLTTSLDTNYDPREVWDNGLEEVLVRTDVFLPNAAECCAIARTDDLEQAMHRLAEKSGLVVVKLGREGAALRQKGLSLRTAAIPVQVADTVGAGDSFDAGFIYGYLSGWERSKCLRLACVCGSLSTQKSGGTDGQPTLEEALVWLASASGASTFTPLPSLGESEE